MSPDSITPSPAVAGAKTQAPPADATAWQELESVFDELSQAVRAATDSEHFYRLLIERTVQALAATGGQVWCRDPQGTMRPVAQTGSVPKESIAELETALNAAADSGCVLTEPMDPAAGKPFVLIAAPVKAIDLNSQGTEAGQPTLAVIALVGRAGANPAVYRGQERFLAAVSEIAAEFHAREELGRLRSFQSYYRSLFAVSRRFHQSTGMRATAYEIANSGQGVIGCDRLSVAQRRGRRCRLVATSGIKRIERRSNTARQLQELSEVALKFQEPIYYSDGTGDCLPQVAELLETYVDQSHARQVAIVPIPSLASSLPEQEDRHKRPPQAVLIAEQFDATGGGLSKQRLVELSEVCSPAIEQAVRWDSLPLGNVLRACGRLFQPLQALKALVIVGTIAAAIAALVLVEADFSVEATGTLQPSVRRNVFASRTGLIDEVLVSHGDKVNQDDVLIRLRDPQLDLEQQRVAGDIETTIKQLSAIRATKTGRGAGDLTTLESYRLSAEEDQLEQQLENYRRQLELLKTQRESLAMRSPLDGTVITWDVDRLLAARLVEGGQVLLTVADLSADWQLELDVADDRMGYLTDAQNEFGKQLTVEYRLASNPEQEYSGKVDRVAGLAQPLPDDPTAEPSVRVEVALDDLPADEGSDLRPGMSARAKIDCGRRPLGYVWLHDVYDAAVRWLTY